MTRAGQVRGISIGEGQKSGEDQTAETGNRVHETDLQERRGEEDYQTAAAHQLDPYACQDSRIRRCHGGTYETEEEIDGTKRDFK